ncbi:SpoIIE family protein phosphatase [uncultured Microscilla sp.]|uniref:PP2C family protein-serine/threonine phosphatase n=1 Tax=uncultured Microscilla sp. TaxID=432653 RepID=UPI002619B2C9|nr:SpoIIE family protein phosphatase [uncultured Microscilla sp.]
MQILTNQPTEEISANDLFFYKNWARFARIMQIQSGQDSENWANHVLQHLVPFVEGFQATLYLKNIADEEVQLESFRFIGGYAIETDQVKDIIYLGEDTIGLVAKSKEKSYITSQEESPVFKAVNTTLLIPIYSILTLPIIYQKAVYGVLEILFHKPPMQQFLDFLDKINNNIGANLCLLLKDEKIRLQNKDLNHQLRQTRNHLIISEEFRKLHGSLTESVEYAQNIQNAILPGNSSFGKLFQDYFIIYKPKDIVSGDFYWMVQTINRDKENETLSKTIFLAVVDCTGHGVPGAFMSMIGTMLLNEIVSRKGIDSPARILKMMHIGVRAALKQSEGQNKDGMDICFCKIKPQNDGQQEITFAGAKRPLYYSEDNQLFKKPGTRRSIGGDSQTRSEPFVNHTIMLATGDKLFLSTDGFKDVASPKRRNFGQQRLELLLQQGLEDTLQAHRELLLTRLKQHQQDAQQRDDITLIGVQL